MIDLSNFEIVENPPEVKAKWMIQVTFVDTINPANYDKMFVITGYTLKNMLRKAEYQCSVVCSAPDPQDIEAVNEFFNDYYLL